MKKYIIYSLLIITFLSCKKQELKLPILHTSALDKVYNNSAVWIFFNIKDNDTLAQLNRNNSIESTNWLFNIDRRLSLKQVYKPLKKLLNKRQKKSPHHVEGLKNYFSFADTIDRKVKFLPFNLKQIIYSIPNIKSPSIINIMFYKRNFVLNNKTFSYSKLDSVTTQLTNNLNTKQVRFYFNDALCFEKYITIKSKINQSLLQKQLQPTTDYYFK